MVRNHSRSAAQSRAPIDESDSDEYQEESIRSTRQSTQNKNKQQNRRKQTEPKKKEDVKYLREIVKLQSSTGHLIPRAPFGRLLKEILQSLGDFRLTKDAFDAFQEASEYYLVALLDDAYKLTLHRQRVTLTPSDVRLILYLRGTCDPGNRT